MEIPEIRFSTCFDWILITFSTEQLKGFSSGGFTDVDDATTPLTYLNTNYSILLKCTTIFC